MTSRLAGATLRYVAGATVRVEWTPTPMDAALAEPPRGTLVRLVTPEKGVLPNWYITWGEVYESDGYRVVDITAVGQFWRFEWTGARPDWVDQWPARCVFVL